MAKVFLSPSNQYDNVYAYGNTTEGNSKANELTTMIANAKATIREQYPDANQSITN